MWILLDHVIRAVGLIAKLKYFVPMFTLLTIGRSQIAPCITYGLVAWRQVCKSSLDKLQMKLQKTSPSLIYSSDHNFPKPKKETFSDTISVQIADEINLKKKVDFQKHSLPSCGIFPGFIKSQFSSRIRLQYLEIKAAQTRNDFLSP